MQLIDDITKTVKDLVEKAKAMMGKAGKQAGEMTDANRDKIGHALDKAGKFVDSKSDGKISHQLDKAGKFADSKTDGKFSQGVAKAKDAARVGTHAE